MTTAAQMKAWRDANPSVRDKERKASRARGRAMQTLREENADRYYELLNEERAKEKLAPVFSEPVGRKPRPWS